MLGDTTRAFALDRQRPCRYSCSYGRFDRLLFGSESMTAGPLQVYS